MNPEVEKIQKKKLEVLRATRDNIAVKSALEELSRKAKTSGNLMPSIINCVKVYATLGEISNTLRGVSGEYKATVTF